MAKQEHSIREILFGAIDFFRNYKKIFFLVIFTWHNSINFL